MIKWTVVQPAATPEIIHLAKSLAEMNRLEVYVSSTPFAADSSWASPPMKRFGRVIQRRVLPSAIPSRATVRAGTLAELVFKSIHGRPYLRETQIRLMRIRAQQVHNRARQVISGRTSDEPRGLVVQAGESHTTLELAKRHGYTTILNTSIVHRRFMAREITRELERYPAWAQGLRDYIRPESELANLDRELEVADIVLVQSKFQQRVLQEYGVREEKIRLLPLGVDDIFHTRSTVQPRDDQKTTVTLGWLGQITQRKGFADLMAALGEDIIESGFDLQVAGITEDDSQNLDQRSGITYRGPIPHGEVGSWLDGIDLLVSPSILEGFSLAPVEAMAAGVPVLVSDRLFISDSITSGVDGWVVPARDVDGLREVLKLIRSLGHHALQDVGMEGSKLVADLRWENYEDRVRDLLCVELGN